MLGWILGAMTADLLYLSQKKIKINELSQQKEDYHRRLKVTMTRGHMKACRCRLCHNRREALLQKLAELK